MNSLKDYGDLFQRLDLTELSVTEGDFRLHLKRENGLGQPTEKTASYHTDIDHVTQAPTETKAAEEQNANLEQIKAPLLGIFNNGTEGHPPVQVGEHVHKGDVLCTIEAMKMFNEVKAPMDGEIREICVQEGALVEYDQTLFQIRAL